MTATPPARCGGAADGRVPGKRAVPTTSPSEPESVRAVEALALAAEYLSLGSHAAARRQAGIARSLLPRDAFRDVRASPLVRDLEAIERDLRPSEVSRSPAPESLGSASVRTVRGGLPGLGRRR